MNSKTEKIFTERLELTLITLQDFEFIFHLVNSPGWLSFIGDRKVSSLDLARKYIEKILATQNFYYWVIRTKENHTPIGIISFIKRDYLPHFDIGFALLPEYHRHGYAHEATVQVIAAYQSLGHKTILATVLPSNENSIRLLRKLGFVHESNIEGNNEALQVFRL